VASTLFADILTDQRVAELISQDYLLLAADRNALPNHPALYYAGDFAGSAAGVAAGSVRKVPIIGLDGYDLPDTVAEGAAITPGQLTDQQFSLYVSRGGKAYQPSDEVRFTDSLGVYNTAAFAQDAMMSHNLRLTNALAALVGGFSLSQSTTGVDLTVAVFLASLTDLEVGSSGSFAPGQVMGVLHTVQVGDLRTSFATATSGAIQWSNVAQEQLVIKGNGYRGQIFGVDLFASGYVPTANAGADRAGGIFARGGIAWADLTPSADTADQVVLGGKVLYERERDALRGLTAYVSATWIGTTRGYDTAPHRLGVSIITDA
jgi:hypothetical protein